MASGIKIGISTMSDIKKGTSQVSAVYQATNLIWPIPSPTPTPTPTPTPIPAASVIYRENLVKNPDASSTYSFTSVGTYGSTFIVIAIHGIANYLSSITSVTIGGVSATQLTSIGGGSFNNLLSFYGATITGTTNNYVVNYSNVRRSCSIGIWTVDNLISTTPTATFIGSVANGAGTAISGSLSGNTVNNVIIGAASNDRSGYFTTWTSSPQTHFIINENYDVSQSNLGNVTGASRQAQNGGILVTSTFGFTPASLGLGTWISLR